MIALWGTPGEGELSVPDARAAALVLATLVAVCTSFALGFRVGHDVGYRAGSEAGYVVGLEAAQPAREALAECVASAGRARPIVERYADLQRAQRAAYPTWALTPWQSRPAADTLSAATN